jgi:hypothetical protein
MSDRARFLALTALVLASPAAAHDTWSSGDPVPDWVKRDCCSQAHAHHVDEAAIHALPDGYHIDGYRHVIPYSKVLPSPDGTTWLFFETRQDGSQSGPFCFFIGAKA